MKSERKFEIILLILSFVFSWWLMTKSFRYDIALHQFQIGRNEVGDFGLHIGFIRSFSWGNNMPPESPFYPGKSLPYHYFFDLTAGFLEKAGMRIDIAVNGLSAAAFTVLLVLIYKLSQLIFGKSKILGLTSVLLFLFPSSLTFWDYLKDKQVSLALVNEIWRLPDYVHKGPFDGSLVSIYFTPAVFLNQRHLLAEMAIGLGIIYFILQKILLNRTISSMGLVVLGILLGLSSRVHSLIAAATLIVVLSFFIFFKKYRWIVLFAVPALLSMLFVYRSVLGQGGSLLSKNFFYLGFLSPRPFALGSFIAYWWSNLWLATIFIPIGFLASNYKQRKIFLSFFALFVIANLFQLSFRIEHNHSFINYFLIMTSCYVAYVLARLGKKKLVGKLIYIVLFLSLISSGILNIMAVKNDFFYPVSDAPLNHLMEWIKDNTDKRAIFLSKQDLYDPVILAGRRNYFGVTYYLQVMGYDYITRQQLSKRFFEANTGETLVLAKREGINYIIIPVKPVNDFPYTIHRDFFQKNLPLFYSDDNVEVYRL